MKLKGELLMYLKKSSVPRQRSTTKKKAKVYGAVVLSTLLYMFQKLGQLSRLISKSYIESLNNRCLRSIKVISRLEQWKQHLST